MRVVRTDAVVVLLATLGVSAALGPGPAAAQDANVLLPTDTIEAVLRDGSFRVVDYRPSRGLPTERTRRASLSLDDGSMVVVKWAPAPRGGEEFNAVPRYEVAAYELQKLFLDESEYVVPPTVIRAFDLAWHRELDDDVPATFRDVDAVLVALQYWLFNVTGDDFWDDDRFEADSVYARHLGNFNILTYLVRHGDQNEGNYLISSIPDNPRVFSVDNGVAFSSRESDRGHRWRRLRIDRLPAATIERLRGVTLETLTDHLATLVEFRILPDGSLERVEPGPPLEPRRGVRETDDRIQLGLTEREIDGVWDRIRGLLEDVDDGDYELF